MPRYFFRITDGDSVPDLNGTEMPDLAAARYAAIDIAAEQLKGSGEKFWTEPPWKLEVTDDDGAVLMTVTVNAELAAASGEAARIK